MNQMTKFQNTLLEVIKQLGADAIADYRRFVATLYDLGSEYTKELRFIAHNVDAKVLEQCAEAAKDGQDPDAIVERVSHYIQREYMSDKEWTNNIVTSLVAAYAAYGGKTSPSIPTKKTEDHSERQRKRQSEKQNKRQIEQDKATSVSADADSYIIQPMGFGYAISESDGSGEMTVCYPPGSHPTREELIRYYKVHRK